MNTFDGVETYYSGESLSGAKKPTPQLSIIWLHGLGADGNDFAPVVPELEKHGVKNCRFVFPHAPMQPVTINGGMKMRSWFDITSLDFNDRKQDSAGIRASAQRTEALVQREIDRGMLPEQIMLAGFSQGGAVVLHCAIRLTQRIVGVIALSTYLPLADTVATEKTPANQQTSIFMAHGRSDDVIEQRYAEASRDVLENHGYEVKWKSYDMGHSLSIEEIVDLANWIKSHQSG